jgi:hypothetical protein
VWSLHRNRLTHDRASRLAAMVARRRLVSEGFPLAAPVADPDVARRSRRPTGGAVLGDLLAQPRDLEGFRMSQKVADANDLPCSKVEDFPNLLAELDAGRPGGQVDLTEG